jgi:hypothetical protein
MIMKLSQFQPVVRYLEEPHIEVGKNVAVPEPKMGWTLLGPLGKQSATYEINLGLIGDFESLEKTKDLLQRLNVTAYGKDKSFLNIAYPGLDKLRIKLIPKWTAEIDGKSIEQQIKNTATLSERITTAARIIREGIKSLMERDPQPDVLILAYPKVVDYYCVEGAIGHRGVPRMTPLEKQIEKARARNMTLESFLGIRPPEKVYRPVDLRSVVKAICMEYSVPIQILRPHTTEPYNPDRPAREDDATTFWNLVVALFYKANHLPWRVRGLMQDTCYLGISFFRDRDDTSNVKTALAQVFSLDAEGFVFKGEKAFIDDNNSPHVSKTAAATLIRYATDVYQRTKEYPPTRIVVHKTSRYNADEFEGFNLGAKGIAKLDLVAFGTRGIKFIRWGQQPPVRGTMVRLPDQSTLLYTFGYIPYLGVYPGPRVPSPLEILEHHGTTPIDTICSEILALTKLNWNNAKFCTKSPITIGFSKRVGEILRQAPPSTKIGDRFKFYM